MVGHTERGKPYFAALFWGPKWDPLRIKESGFYRVLESMLVTLDGVLATLPRRTAAPRLGTMNLDRLWLLRLS